MKDGSGALLSSWINIADFKELISNYDPELVNKAEKWQHLGATLVEINGFKKHRGGHS